MSSKLIESLRGDLAKLQKVGAISKVAVRQFDSICPPPIREFSADDIKRLREKLQFSQPVFAHLVHTTASTVRKWEQGDDQPPRATPTGTSSPGNEGFRSVFRVFRRSSRVPRRGSRIVRRELRIVRNGPGRPEEFFLPPGARFG